MTENTDVTETPKKTGLKNRGFGSHPDLINKTGRPKGSRNKSTLLKAQLNIDNMAGTAVEVLEALMNNDKDRLNTKENVPVTVRIQACKVILDKAMANEKNKVGSLNEKAKEDDKEDKVVKPVFSATPIKKEGNG